METMSARRGLCARPPSGKVGRTGRARGSNHICPKWSNMSGRGPSHQARRAGGLDGVPGSAIHSDYSLLWLGSLVYGRGEECVACDNLSRFERGQVMIRQTANAHKSTHTRARARQKVYYHCYVRSLPPGLVDYEMPGILAARLAAMRQNRKLLTRCHSIALRARRARGGGSACHRHRRLLLSVIIAEGKFYS